MRAADNYNSNSKYSGKNIVRSPLVPLVASYIIGIFCGDRFQIPAFLTASFSILTLCAILFLFILKKKGCIIYFLLPGFFLAGILNISILNDHLAASADIQKYLNSKEKLRYEGIISSAPQVLPERIEVTVSSVRVSEGRDYRPLEGKILLTIQGNLHLDYGDYIRFKTTLRTPRNFNNPGRFNFERRLLHQGIYARGFIKDDSGIVVIRKMQGGYFRTLMENYRQHLKAVIEQNAPYPEAKIIQASILGNQKEIPDEIMEKFNRTGTSHIIAISGFNIGIIAMLSFFIIRSFMKSSEYLMLRFNIVKTSSIMAVMPIILFTLIAGAGISVIRATIMVITFMIALVFNKDRNLYDSLALAAFVILVFSPYSLFDVSFQLSFAAVLSILFISPVLSHVILKKRTIESHEEPGLMFRAYRSFVLFIIVTISATIGTLPLTVFYFNRVSTVVLLSNLAVVPVLGIIAIPLCTSIIIAAPLSASLAAALITLCSWLVAISLHLVDFFASLPFSSFLVTTPTIPEIVIFYIFVIAIVTFLKANSAIDTVPEDRASGKKRLWGAAVICCLVFFIGDGMLLHLSNKHSGNLRITFIDVGQGNSALLRFPAGRTMLVDGGGSFNDRFDIGQRVIAPFLWHEKVSVIDAVVLTHPHPDHLNGLIYILENFDVKEIWTNGETSSSEAWQRMISAVSRKGIRHRLVSRKTHPEIEMDGVLIRVLNPPVPVDQKNSISRRYNETNDAALVLGIAYGDNAILLPADISGETEDYLAVSGESLKSRVMLVPHHGSYTSSTERFLEKARPEFAVISCGRDNAFGLPNPDVLERYAKMGTKLLRTDQHGAVTFTMDRKDISFEFFLSRD